MEERTGELAPPTIFVNFAETKRFTKTLSKCSSDRDYLFYWFLNGWRYDKSGLPKELETKSITKTLSRACEIAAFTLKIPIAARTCRGKKCRVCNF